MVIGSHVTVGTPRERGNIYDKYYSRNKKSNLNVNTGNLTSKSYVMGIKVTTPLRIVTSSAFWITWFEEVRKNSKFARISKTWATYFVVI